MEAESSMKAEGVHHGVIKVVSEELKSWLCRSQKGEETPLNFRETLSSKRTLEFDFSPNENEANLKHMISHTIQSWKEKHMPTKWQ